MRLLSCLLLLSLLGCAAPDEGSSEGFATERDLAIESLTLRTEEDGTVTVPIDVLDRRSFLVTAETGHGTALRQLIGPRGEVLVDGAHWYQQPHWYSEAIVGGSIDTSFNWPIRAADPQLADGLYTAVFEVYDQEGHYLGGQPVDVTIHQNRDDDLSRGFVRVLVVWADGVDDDPEATLGTRAAVERWAAIWAQAGIDFEVQYVSSDIEPALTSPGGSDQLQRANQLGDGDQLIVLVGDTVAGGGTLGEAGGIPGPLIATSHSGMVLGWLESAGSDGLFAPEEIEVFAETMAHEMGHYLGLFHPFEQAEGEVVEAWDALSDTPDCVDPYECEVLFATNVMVPYTVYDAEDLPVPAVELSHEQRAAMQRYTGIVTAPASGSSTQGLSSSGSAISATPAPDHSGSHTRVARLSARAAELRHALSWREAAHACPTGFADDSYRELVDKSAMPSYIPMRALRCLVEQAGEGARQDVERWSVRPGSAGLQRLAKRLPVRTSAGRER